LPPDQPKCDIAGAMPSVQKSIENRINGGLALTDAIVTQEGGNRLVVQLPGLTDDTQARQLLGKTARCTHRHCVAEPAVGPTSPG
jgi:preprotein translocase subunit SecD